MTALRRSAPAEAEQVAERLAQLASRPPTSAEAHRATDLLLSGLIARMESLRLREKQRLAAVSVQKTAFLFRVSHELRTPLNAILGFSQLLELDVEDAGRESVQQILTAGRQLLELVDDLLDIGRIKAGQLNLHVAPVQLATVVGEVLGMLRPVITERELQVVDGSDATTVPADPGRLRQVLLNVIGNAVKYNSVGGELEISVLRTPDAARIAVRDTGPGTSAEQVELLFVPFERLDAPSRGISGTGLGLVVSTQLVEAMRGRLEVDSRVGIGSTFTIALPASTPG